METSEVSQTVLTFLCHSMNVFVMYLGDYHVPFCLSAFCQAFDQLSSFSKLCWAHSVVRDDRGITMHAPICRSIFCQAFDRYARDVLSDNVMSRHLGLGF